MKLLFCLSLLVFCCKPAPAQPTDNRLTTVGDAVLDVPADQVVMTISLSYGDDKDASLVYELHLLNQRKLAALLSELKVPAAAIVYTQLLTRKERDFVVSAGGTQDHIKSFQQVIITLTDMSQFAAVQRRLVSDGFTDLVSVFRLRNQSELENQLLVTAIGRAREKADLMAKAIARTVKRVIRLSDADETDPVDLRGLLIGMPAGSQPRFTTALNQTTQTVRLTSRVKLVAELE